MKIIKKREKNQAAPKAPKALGNYPFLQMEPSKIMKMEVKSFEFLIFL